MNAKMFRTSFCIIAIVATSIGTAAYSATLRNLDKSAHKVVIVEGDARQEHSIASQQELNGVCATTCSIYVGADPDPYDLAASDKVQIQDGELYYMEEQNLPTDPA